MRQITANSRPARIASVVWRREENEVLVFDPETAQLSGLNETASFLWESFDGKKNVNEIVDLGIDRFDVDRETLLGDVMLFVQDLSKRGLVKT